MNDRSVVVLAAMPRELRPLVRAFRLRPTASAGLPAWDDGSVLAVAVGVGPARASAGAANVLQGVTAARVVVTGVAGGIDSSLGVGDLVRPAAVVDVRTGVVRTPTRGGARSGVLATVERIYLSGTGPTDEPAVRLPPDTTAVDMETAAIAAVCDAKGVPWDVVRAISDVAGTLTPEIASLLRPDGRVDMTGATRLVLRDPRSIGRLVRLGLDTARAVRATNRVVVAEIVVERLPRSR